MAKKHSIFYLGNDHIVRLSNLSDQDGNAITGATVELVALVDASGADVGNVSLPITMPHVGAGTYEASLPNEASIDRGSKYLATVRAVSGDTQGEWEEVLIGRVRRA